MEGIIKQNENEINNNVKMEIDTAKKKKQINNNVKMEIDTAKKKKKQKLKHTLKLKQKPKPKPRRKSEFELEREEYNMRCRATDALWKQKADRDQQDLVKRMKMSKRRLIQQELFLCFDIDFNRIKLCDTTPSQKPKKNNPTPVRQETPSASCFPNKD
ncbi:hypothetical protein BVRB_3g052870 [Beta vulgaris subsp. vulgaris]|nr:hypothetical protein BVRB_3g052870 [Beta vulgaris subsp. vulgaris]